MLLGFEPERVPSNPLLVVGQPVVPSPVSYWSAVHFYGFAEQVPLTVFASSTKKKRPVTFRGKRDELGCCGEGSYRAPRRAVDVDGIA